MIYLPIILLIIFLGAYKILLKINWTQFIVFSLAGIIISAIIIGVDIQSQITDTEVWSGQIISVGHKEEWDEWIPPKTETYNVTKTVGGKTKTEIQTRTIPGHWQHHYSENWLETSDDGRMYLEQSPDGKKFNDSWPNKIEELYQYWKVGDPSASVHTYENKVQASYSLYKHEQINLKQYNNLPDYPNVVKNYTSVDRIIGDIPNKEQALKILAQKNTELNKSIPDPEKPGKTRSWKQVNIIFVNVGSDKTEDYGFALQDKWENGNKNDFVISFSMNNDGTLNWVYPFSWSESETLKLHIRDYMMDLKTITNFVPIVEEISKYVANEFIRKQFADFNYLQIESGNTAKICIWIFNTILVVVIMFVCINNDAGYKSYKFRKRWR